eukprot:gb/GFBE01028048.1/.p1 GENE.gb/GFBE01028048.1/~~gb/GFBE01028048.1/.p1  ORF type:complete len:144 (+),score=26.49 gb/GFBE01028048.1/:1-432(+)
MTLRQHIAKHRAPAFDEDVIIIPAEEFWWERCYSTGKRSHQMRLDGTCLCVGRCRCLGAEAASDKRDWCGFRGFVGQMYPRCWRPSVSPSQLMAALGVAPASSHAIEVAEEDSSSSSLFVEKFYMLIDWIAGLMRPKLTDGSV